MCNVIGKINVEMSLSQIEFTTNLYVLSRKNMLTFS